MTGHTFLAILVGLAISVLLNIAIGFIPKLWIRQTIRFSIMILCALIVLALNMTR